MRLNSIVLVFVLFIAPQCGASDIDRWSAVEVETIDGFAIPESVAIDPSDGSVYVSNIDASTPEDYWADDNKGSIARLAGADNRQPQVLVKCGRDTKLHSPKGMCVVDRSLWVADNTRLRRFSLGPDLQPTIFEIPGAQRLNDVVAHAGAIYVSDTGAGKVYRVAADGAVKTIQAPATVNGITFAGNRMFAVSWGEHEVYQLDPTGSRPPEPFGLAEHFTNLDGIEVLDDGTFIVSDLKGSEVWLISADRKTVRKLIELDSPADIGLDRRRMRLYVPQFMKDRVAVYELKRDRTLRENDSP